MHFKQIAVILLPLTNITLARGLPNFSKDLIEKLNKYGYSKFSDSLVLEKEHTIDLEIEADNQFFKMIKNGAAGELDFDLEGEVGFPMGDIDMEIEGVEMIY